MSSNNRKKQASVEDVSGSVTPLSEMQQPTSAVSEDVKPPAHNPRMDISNLVDDNDDEEAYSGQLTSSEIKKEEL